MSLTQLLQGQKYQKSHRVGRGLAGKGGKTAGRGTKGQKSRTGSHSKLPQWFEGGQTPVFRKMAKVRGFKRSADHKLTLTTKIVNLFYKAGETVSPASLLEKKIITSRDLAKQIKIINSQPLKAKLKFEQVNLSKSLKPGGLDD